MLNTADSHEQNAIIKVIGVGGGGGNAVEHMVSGRIDGVSFVCANTDAQALRNSGADALVQLGEQITKGLGAGANPDVGRQSAEEDRDHLRELLKDCNMVFITAGMGGGTGTGAAPVVAEIAKELGILTVAVVTRPFTFEGRQRAVVAEQGIQALSQHVDSLITIPNDKLLAVLGKNITLIDAFKAANDVLLGAVQGIAELITRPGLINVDFADVRTVMSEMGMAMMGTGSASGDDRARCAAEAAVASPLLEDIDLSGARGVLVNITAGLDMAIGEFEEVGEVVKGFISDDATVVVGTVIDPELQDELRVTVIVTGLGGQADMTASNMMPAGRQRLRRPERIRRDAVDYRQPVMSERVQVGARTANMATQHAAAPMSPATTNNTAHSAAGATPAAEEEADVDMAYLDIPAFLRRQEEQV